MAATSLSSIAGLRGRDDRYAEFAADLVQRKVDATATAGTTAVIAVKKETSTIPIIFAAAGDPVRTGWSPAWRARAAMSLACRTCRPILAATDLSCCVKSWPA